MRYRTDIEVNVPINRFMELFDRPENMKNWQPDLISYEQLSENPTAVGAQMKLQYKMGKREMEMLETITERNLPDVFSTTYEADGVWNSVINRFESTSPDTTKWAIETEFKFDSIMMKLMAFLMPGMFKKQSCKYMENFKAFAEGTKNS